MSNCRQNKEGSTIGAHREKNMELVKRREENRVAYLAEDLRLVSRGLLNVCRSTFLYQTEPNIIKKTESSR